MNEDRNANELNSEHQTEEPITEEPIEPLHPEPPTPLFLEDSAEGQQGDAQDEKDKTEE